MAEVSDDAKKLIEVYTELHIISGRLVEIEERHKSAKHFQEVINKAISELEDVIHLVFKEAYELTKEEGNGI